MTAISRQQLLAFMRQEIYAVQASISTGGGPQAALVRVTPIWIRYSNFSAEPQEIAEFRREDLGQSF